MGSSHHQNDDAIYHSDNGPIDENGVLALICDGVSSVKDGGWAAQTVCSSFQDLFAKIVDVKPKDFIKRVAEINNIIRTTPKRRGACTMALLWIKGSKGYVMSVGDSQVGLLRDRKMSIYTEQRVSSGQLSSFIGMKGDIKNNLYQRQFDIEDGDLILLMSDGVSEIVGSTDVFHVWKHCYEDPQLCAERLVQLARYSGSTDDNSAIVLHYRSE